MQVPLKLFKSAGVPVTAAVHRLLLGANQARDAERWTLAAEGYGEALKRDPQLAHIWLQYGHALKEGGDFAGAVTAYAKAAELQPASAEPHLHLGHVAKQQGDREGARRAYMHAAELDPREANVVTELRSMIAGASDASLDEIVRIFDPAATPASTSPSSNPDAVRSALRKLVDQWARTGAADGDALTRLEAAEQLIGRLQAGDESRREVSGLVLMFDVSDLLAYFTDSRSPTGIQRVQIETISHAISEPGVAEVRVCCFSPERDAWVEAPGAAFVALCRQSLQSGDVAVADWSTAILRLQVSLAKAEPLVFPSGAFLINLGTSWWIKNYFMALRRAKAACAGTLYYVPFAHDFIPILSPACCTEELTRDFIDWTLGMFNHADFFLVNSNSTRRELLSVAETLGHVIDPERVRVIALNADSRRASSPPARSDLLAVHGLARSPFVLFVSTIEARKNHLLAFDAWLELIRAHGLRQVPKLVCVGKRGWLEEAVFAKLAAHEALRDRVVMISGLSDGDVAELYRRCLFTLYPSTFEGWGLPVTESLCHGKVPLVSNSSSLPEAGGPFAAYFEPGSSAQLTGALEELIYDPAFRQACEAKIAAEFRPRSWSEVAGDIIEAATGWSAVALNEHEDRTPQAVLGAFHPLSRSTVSRIWPGLVSTEAYRDGFDWWGLEDFGCWAKAGGAGLQFSLAGPHGPLRVFVALRALPSRSVRIELEADGALAGAPVDLDPKARRWVAIDVKASEDDRPRHHLRLNADGAENLAGVTDGGDRRVISFGVEGFFLCAADDAAARATFLEAVVLGALPDLAINREPSAAASPLANSSLGGDEEGSRSAPPSFAFAATVLDDSLIEAAIKTHVT